MTSEEFLKRVADSAVAGQVTVTATEIRHNLHDAIEFLAAGGLAVVVTKHGKEVFRMVTAQPAPTPPADSAVSAPKPENVDANGTPVSTLPESSVTDGLLPVAA